MFAIYKREMRSYFTTPIGYIFLAIFFAVSGAVFAYSTLYSMTADTTVYFTFMMFVFIVLLPLLTMKLFSEEKKMRTDQLLLTAPISIVSMVSAKFLAAYTMFAGSMLVSSLQFLILYRYAAVKTAVLLGNLLAILLVGMAFIAVGTFVSSLAENQLAAAVGTIGILFGLGAAVFYASVVLINKFIRNVDGIHRTLLQFLAAVVTLIPYVALSGGVTLGGMNASGWICLFIVGLVHTGVTYCLYFSSLRELPGQKAAILSYIDPLVAVLISVTVLGEAMTLPQVLGGVLILGFTLWNEISADAEKQKE